MLYKNSNVYSDHRIRVNPIPNTRPTVARLYFHEGTFFAKLIIFFIGGDVDGFGGHARVGERPRNVGRRR
jgi:hypothetical protein